MPEYFYSKIVRFSFFLVFLNPLLFAQDLNFERIVSPFPMYNIQNDLIKLPFIGGFNAPIHQWLDIDNDQDLDLFTSDNLPSLTFFENIGTAEEYHYVWTTDLYENLTVGSWFKFIDIDNDLDFDLFAENSNGIIRLYINDGSISDPQFSIAVDSLKDINGNYIRAEGFSIPDWTDIDCDNDFDFFLGKQNGTITYYENIGIVNQIPQYDLITFNFEDLEIITGGLDPELKVDFSDKQSHHGNNSISFVDINNDNDNDIFWGDLFAPSIVFLENFGSCSSARFINSTIIETFNMGDPILTAGYNFSRFGDIDNDGDLDMLASALIGSDFSSNLLFYENQGDVAFADFKFIAGDFIDMLDIGNYAMPAFVDIDNDSDIDLFIANDLDGNAPQKQNSRLHYFENQGTSTMPNFVGKSDNYLEVDREFEVSYSPAFADLNNDGDFDLYLGGWNGKIIEYENIGNADSAIFNRSNEEYFGIDVGSNCTISFADMDNDSDLDLLLGEFSGKLNYYMNAGSISNPDFVLQSDNYFSIQTGLYSHPYLKDITNDGLIDLIVGSEQSGIVYYQNEGSLQNPFFDSNNSIRIAGHRRTAPVLTDIDNDSDYDLFAGVNGGGLVYYKNNTKYSAVNIKGIEILNYPNPFSIETQIKFFVCDDCSNAQTNTLTLYDILGRKVKKWQIQGYDQKTEVTVKWNGTNSQGDRVANGIYYVRLNENSVRPKTGKILLLR